MSDGSPRSAGERKLPVLERERYRGAPELRGKSQKCQAPIRDNLSAMGSFLTHEPDNGS